MNISSAIIRKSISADRNSPTKNSIPNRFSVAFCQAPAGKKTPITGIINALTVAVTKSFTATPITNAIAKPITPYSSRNWMKSSVKDIRKNRGCEASKGLLQFF